MGFYSELKTRYKKQDRKIIEPDFIQENYSLQGTGQKTAAR
jgi:hypothetical protein